MTDFSKDPDYPKYLGACQQLAGAWTDPFRWRDMTEYRRGWNAALDAAEKAFYETVSSDEPFDKIIESLRLVSQRGFE